MILTVLHAMLLLLLITYFSYSWLFLCVLLEDGYGTVLYPMRKGGKRSC